MSDPPASIRPSIMSSSSSGDSATTSSGGRISAIPPARCTASEYVRGERFTTTSQAAQRALSIAAQRPMTGRSLFTGPRLLTSETFEAAVFLPIGHSRLVRVDLDAGVVQVVAHHVLAEGLARDG